MDLVVPAEVRRHNETNTEDGARDWLDTGLHRDGRDLMDALFDRQAYVDVVQHVTNLVLPHLFQLVHRELLLLQTVEHDVA